MPDKVVDCQPSLVHALTMIGQQYRAARHVRVHIFEGESAALTGLFAYSTRDDVVVSDAATIDRLAAQNLLQPHCIGDAAVFRTQGWGGTPRLPSSNCPEPCTMSAVARAAAGARR